MIFGLDIGVFIFLVLCLALVAAFEFINGFHDTANAVAPVIYTKSLKAKYAVIISGVMNFLGVVLGGIGVAMAIIHLLPLDAIGYQSQAFGIVVVISLLLSAIIWNFATWFFGIPASSSHSLIGAILGVTIAMMQVPMVGGSIVKPNWGKAIDVIQALLISPVVGFILASSIMYLAYRYIKNKYYFGVPGNKKHRPRIGLRAMLIGTSAWVSFAHGSNDGQKGVGLAMLILVILAPGYFAINPYIKITDLNDNIVFVENSINGIDLNTLNESNKIILENTKINLIAMKELTNAGENMNKFKLREEVLKFQKNINQLNIIESTSISSSNLYATSVIDSKNITNSQDLQNKEFSTKIDGISKMVDYAPLWIILLISISLGMGTMIGRKRIVKTIGEKIGKTDMNYTQATISAMMTAITITLASQFHLPVSTTHILSSSVAGTMTVGPDSEGVRKSTVKNILLAWVLTLPVTMFLSATIFFLLWFVFVK